MLKIKKLESKKKVNYSLLTHGFENKLTKTNIHSVNCSFVYKNLYPSQVLPQSHKYMLDR